MRLLIWNIHKGIGGTDRRYAPGRVAAVLRHYDADVVLLQEVDDGVPRSGRDRQVDLFADVADYEHRAFGANVRLTHGTYGNATLSRHPIVSSENIALRFGPKKPRGALCTDLHVTVGGHRLALHVVNLHLGLSGVERRWQVRRLLASEPLRRLDRTSRLIVAGDTNDWTGALPGGALAEAGFTCITGRGRHATRTFPAWGPVGALDRIFVRGPVHPLRAYTSRLDLARQASDHLPVVADLELVARG